MSIYRELSFEEIVEFKKWARDNYTPFSEINSIWHPVVKNECAYINAETRINAERSIDLNAPVNGYYPVAYFHRDDIKELGYDAGAISDSEMMEIREKLYEAAEYGMTNELRETLKELKVPKI